MLRFLLIWIILALVLGMAFGKFAKAGMGSQNDEYREKKEAADRDDDACP